MKAILQIALGKDILIVEDEVKNLQDLFRFHSMFSILPKTGPNGEDDLYLCYRKAQGKFDYYSVVSEKAGQEFKFGITMESHELFPKGWEPIQRGRFIEGVEQEPHFIVQAATAAQSSKPSEPRPPQASAGQQQAEPAKTEQQVLLNEFSRLVNGTLIHNYTKEFAGDFFFALTGVPKQQASVNALKLAIAACSMAVKQPAMLHWASAAWRAETSTLFSLTSKMNCLGWMVRFLGDGGDFKDLQQKINGDPTTKDYKSFLVMRDNLKSWLTPEEGELTDRDIGF